MNNEELINRVGIAFIAAGHALIGTKTKEVETKTEKEETPKVEAKTEEKPKRKRKTKAVAKETTKQNAKIDEETWQETKASDDFGGEEIHEAEVVEANAGPALDEDAIKKALVAYAKTNGKEKAFGVLGNYNAKKVADLNPKHYAEVYELVAVNA